MFRNDPLTKADARPILDRMSRISRLLDSRPAQVLALGLNLCIATTCALAAYHRWESGGFLLAVSIFGVIVFLLGAYFAAHYLATGRHHFAKLS